MEIFIIIWLICAGLGYMIAPDNRKGMGMTLGFIFGPLGVVLAAFIG